MTQQEINDKRNDIMTREFFAEEKFKKALREYEQELHNLENEFRDLYYTTAHECEEMSTASKMSLAMEYKGLTAKCFRVMNVIPTALHD